MDINSWLTGLAVALILGGAVTQYYSRKIKKLVGKNDPAYRISIPITIGVVENLFFTLGVAFDISGVMIAMVAWMASKMAAHWGDESLNHDPGNIGSIRFLLLSGTLTSMLFSIIGGLICAGRISF